MLRDIATWWSRWVYVWRKENEAGLHSWSARVAERNAEMTRAAIAKFTKEAEAFDVRIKQVAEMEEKGFYVCDDGHESAKPFLNGTDSFSCPFPIAKALNGVCAKPAKFIKRSEMSGQEKYDSDKERKDAEKLLEAKRADIAQQEKDLEAQQQTAKYFRGQAASSRGLAESLRKL